MSSTFFQDGVTHVPAEWANDVNTLVYSVFGGAQNKEDARQNLGLGSLAEQDSDNVGVTGGSLDNVRIGVSTPAIEIKALRISTNSAPSSADDVINLGYFTGALDSGLNSMYQSLRQGIGSMGFQNKNNVDITGGTLNGVVIGANESASGRFSTLKLLGTIAQDDDAVSLGYLKSTYGHLLDLGSMSEQNSTEVSITGGSIDGTAIGSSTPALGRFTLVKIYSAPSQPEDGANKEYVDGVVSDLTQGFGTMALQDADDVAIIGGKLNGVQIGETNPDYAAFSSVGIKGLNSRISFYPETGVSDVSGVNYFAGSTYKGGIFYANYLYGETSLRDRLCLVTRTEFVVRAANVGVTSAIFGEDTYFHPVAGRSIFGTPASITSEKVQISGQAYADSLRTQDVFVNLANDNTDGYNRVQIAGQARSRGWNGELRGVTATGASTSLNFEYSSHRVLLNQNTTLSFLNQYTTSSVLLDREVTVYVQQGVAGGKSLAFPSNVVWLSGSAPNFAAMLSYKMAIITLRSCDNGVTWYAASLGSGSSPSPSPVPSPVGSPAPVGVPVGKSPVGSPAPVGVPVG